MSIIIYPAYFNIHYSRKEGRRVPRNLAFDAKLDTVSKALKELGYKFEVEVDKKYPRFWWKEKGRVIVYTDEKKNDVLIKIAKTVKKV